MCTGSWWGNLRERDDWGDPDVDGIANTLKNSTYNKYENSNVLLSTCYKGKTVEYIDTFLWFTQTHRGYLACRGHSVTNLM